jgi:hypothetical protein
MTIYQHIRYPRISSRLAEAPVKVADMLPGATAVNRFNTSRCFGGSKILPAFCQS